MWGSGDGGANILNSFAEKYASLVVFGTVAFGRAFCGCQGFSHAWESSNDGIVKIGRIISKWKNTPSLYCLRLAINGAMFKSRL